MVKDFNTYINESKQSDLIEEISSFINFVWKFTRSFTKIYFKVVSNLK